MLHFPATAYTVRIRQGSSYEWRERPVAAFDDHGHPYVTDGDRLRPAREVGQVADLRAVPTSTVSSVTGTVSDVTHVTAPAADSVTASDEDVTLLRQASERLQNLALRTHAEGPPTPWTYDAGDRSVRDRDGRVVVTEADPDLMHVSPFVAAMDPRMAIEVAWLLQHVSRQNWYLATVVAKGIAQLAMSAKGLDA